MRFVIVEYPDTTFGSVFLAKRPGASIDVISEPATGPPDDRRHPCIALVQGLEPADLRTLVTGLEHLHEEVQPLSNEPRKGRWLGRFTVRERALRDTTTLKVLRFQERFGAPWAHSEGGLIHLRARLHDGVDGEQLVEAMQKDLARQGIQAQVELRELGGHDYSVWEQLVQHAIGLS